jgi:tRNA pseudouridine38-40 synthase
LRALNAHLPATVRVVHAEAARAGFHARFDAASKQYRYRFWNGPAVSPFERLYVWHITGLLDVDAMNDAARRLEGKHDFAAFQGTGSSVATTVRTITASLVSRPAHDERPRVPLVVSSSHRELVVYEVAADGFLRHMVRTIAGTLVDVGLGRRPASWMDEVLASCDRRAAGQTAPASGLFLVAVDYGRQLASDA